MTTELKAAISCAQAAGEIAMRHFRPDTEVLRKSDHSPVTKADTEGESLIRDWLSREFSGHGFLGEEFGAEDSGAESVWVIDPIDGTKSFIYGIPLFGVIIGLKRCGEPVLGVAHFPAMGETVWAEIGHGAFCDGELIHVSEIDRIEDSLLVCGSHAAFEKKGWSNTIGKLGIRALATRTWGDAYGHCMVARGRAEAMLDPIVMEWDTCGVQPIIVEAGGTFTNFGGERGYTFGEQLSTNGLILSELTAAFDAP